MRGKEEVVEVSTGSPSIAGRYERFNTKLGQGAFKIVFKAFDTLEQIDVAWNCIDLSCINIHSEREKIFKECDILRKLNHPNILKIGDKWYNERDGHLNFITNIVHDGSLSKYFKNRSINLIRIKKIAKQILSALAYLHRNGIIHRDLKGDNIFIEGNTGNVVIGDLGLSCNVMSARSIVGTPHFMAPELFKEEYNEMVDIWSFGMVILELVTQQIPYSECKGAFQAYQTIVSGTKPLTFSRITNNYIRYFIEHCLQLEPTLRPTAVELLEHPFLLNRITDKILCHKCVKSKNRQYPEPPASPIKITANPPIRTQIRTPTRTPTPTHSRPSSKPSTPTRIHNSITSPEKVVVEKVINNNDNANNIYKITMQIFSNSFSDKVVTVEFDYDNMSDRPQAVADEMCKALKLPTHFLHKIESAIIDAIHTSNTSNTIEIINEEDIMMHQEMNELLVHVHVDEKEDKKEDEPDKKSDKSVIASDAAMSLSRAQSRETIAMKLREKQDTELWLHENGLSELIPIFHKESLTMEHLRDITDDMIKEMCDQFAWNIVTRLKLQKAVKDLKVIIFKPQTQTQQLQQQNIKLEQSHLFDELNRKHEMVSYDMNQVKHAINELEHSAKDCNNAVRQNCDQMIALIEQARDKLLAQIKSFKDSRKESLQQTLNILTNIYNTIINSQKICQQIVNKNELQAFMRLQQINQVLQTLQQEENKNNILDNTIIDKSNYKFKLNVNVQNFIHTVQQSMKLQFSENEFELIYNNDINHHISNHISDDINNDMNNDIKTLVNANLSNSNLLALDSSISTMNSSQIRANVVNAMSKKLVIDDITLEFNETDFIEIRSPKSSNKSHNKHNKHNKQSTTLNSLSLHDLHEKQHNINPATSFHNRTQSAHYAHGLIQSNYSHHQHHMSSANINSTLNTLNTHYVRSSPLINMKKKTGICIERDEILVDAYISKYSLYFNMCLPELILQQTLRFYHYACELVKFSKIYKSSDGWRFYDGQTCIKRLSVAATEDAYNEDEHCDDDEVYQNYKWILSHIKPIIKYDIICWRIWIRNPNKGLIVIGICKQRMFKSDQEHKNMVYGIGIVENKWYPILNKDHRDNNDNNNKAIKHNKIKLNNFHQRQCQIDMKLNTINGTLAFYVVRNNKGDINKENEAKISGLPLDCLNRNGFVPYFNSYQNSVGCQLKIAVCPVSYYGKFRNDIFQ